MNKKVKWSVISVSSAALLTFAGLVAGNNENKDTKAADEVSQDNTLNNQFSDNGNDQQRSFNWDDEEDYKWEHDEDDDWGDDDHDSEHDQYFQAPSGGFEQGHGSSGSSK